VKPGDVLWYEPEGWPNDMKYAYNEAYHVGGRGRVNMFERGWITIIAIRSCDEGMMTENVGVTFLFKGTLYTQWRDWVLYRTRKTP
jgi:hypothetical protein